MVRRFTRVRVACVLAASLLGTLAACASDDPIGDANAACGATGQSVCKANCARPYPFAPLRCDLYCTDLQSDTENCGVCDHVCSAGQMCIDGACMVGCPDGDSLCSVNGGAKRCVNTNSDDTSCGGCGHACKPGWACESGMCLPKCGDVNSGLTACASDAGAFCVKLLSDHANCGKCGRECSASTICSAGDCVAAPCAPGQIPCNGTDGAFCANFQSDNQNCGVCGLRCGPLKSCVKGECVAWCTGDTTACTPDGGVPYCAALDSDNTNCGACGTACPKDKPVCSSGVCGDGLCRRTALVLGDGDPTSTTAYKTTLQAAGFTVTVLLNGATGYFAQPNASAFGVVVMSLDHNFVVDMPSTGQNALLQAQAFGVGIVLTEWIAFATKLGHDGKLAALTLLQPTTNQYGSLITFALTSPNHPIWDGLPNTFTTTVPLGSNVTTTLVNGGVQIASSPEAGIGVAALDPSGGRIVHIAHSASYNGGAWYSDANLVQLAANSALWAARCK